jgi:hypothetical protein
MRSFLLSLAGALAVVLAGSAAHADDAPDAERAAALFAEGRQLMAAGDYAAACPKFAESQALVAAADTALDLGICYQSASQAAFKVAHDLAPPPDGTAGVSAPPRAVMPDADSPSPGQTQRIVGLAIGGAGIAGVVVGVIAAIDTKLTYDRAKSDCAGAVCSANALAQLNSAESLARASTISLVAGVAALGGGAIVYFTAPRPKASAGPSVGLGPAAQGAGLSVGGRF